MLKEQTKKEKKLVVLPELIQKKTCCSEFALYIGQQKNDYTI